MSGNLIAIISIIAVLGAPAGIIITLAVLKHRQKMEMVRQGINPSSDFPRYPGRGPLLWGMIFIGLGIAAVASALYDPDHELMQWGFLFLGAGIALLVYWKLTAPERERIIRLIESRTRESALPMREER